FFFSSSRRHTRFLRDWSSDVCSSDLNTYSTGKLSFSEVNYSALIKAQKDNVFGKVGGAVTLGGNLMEQKFSGLTVSTGALEVPNLFSPTNGTGAPGISPEYRHKKINSLYGSLGINYDGWIFLDVSARNDWSSSLLKANRSYFYPSFSLSYVLSDMITSNGGSLPVWWSYA